MVSNMARSLSAKDIAGLKVAELKEECRSRGLKISGVKQELIDRLKAQIKKEAKAKPNKKVVKSTPLKSSSLSTTSTGLPATPIALSTTSVTTTSTAAHEPQHPVQTAPVAATAKEPCCNDPVVGTTPMQNEPAKQSEVNVVKHAVAEAAVEVETSTSTDASKTSSSAPMQLVTPALLEQTKGGKASQPSPMQDASVDVKPRIAPDEAVVTPRPAGDADGPTVAAPQAKMDDTYPAAELAPEVHVATSAEKNIGAPESISTKADVVEDKCEITTKACSRSPPAWLRSIPTATRRRFHSPRSDVKKEVDGEASRPTQNLAEPVQSLVARSRSPMPTRVKFEMKEELKDDLPQTPSKFGHIMDRLQAKKRGEDVGSGWTPRQSPLRTKMFGMRQPFGVAESPRSKLPDVPSGSWKPQRIAQSPVPRFVAAKVEPDICHPLAESHTPAPPAEWTPTRQKATVADEKRRLLESLTDKMKVCLTKMQDARLDEGSVEKYRTLAQTIRKQMDAVSQAPERSPAPTFSRSPAMMSSSPFSHAPMAPRSLSY